MSINICVSKKIVIPFFFVLTHQPKFGCFNFFLHLNLTRQKGIYCFLENDAMLRFRTRWGLSIVIMKGEGFSSLKLNSSKIVHTYIQSGRTQFKIVCSLNYVCHAMITNILMSSTNSVSVKFIFIYL